MPNPLTYVAADFTTSSGNVDPEQLREEFAVGDFSSTPVTFDRIDIADLTGTFTVSVWFSGVPNATDEATADGIVAAHDATGPTNTITQDPVEAGSLTPLVAADQPDYAEGTFFYDGDEHTLAVFNDEAEVTLQLGQEGFVRVYNNSGATITNGSVVYASGAEGVEFRPTIALARADAATTTQVIGFATHDIENNTFGYVTYWGLINDLDTSAFTAGDPLYLSDTTAGAVTAAAPRGSGSYRAFLGYVIRSDVSAGRVLVTIAADTALPAGDATELVVEATKDSVGTINPGEVVRIVGFNVGQGRPTVELADSSAASTMPAIGIARDSFTNSTSGFVVVTGSLTGQDTSSFSVGDELYVSETAGALTSTRPTGTALVQKIAQVTRSNVSTGTIEVFGAGRSNALPNLPTDNVWLGDGTSVPAETTMATLAGKLDHGLLLGKADDDHTQYALLAGRATGQTLTGGTAASEDLTLESTSNATKGSVILAAGTNLDVSDEDVIGVKTITSSGPETQTTSGSTLTIDLSTGMHHRITLASNITTVSLTDPVGPGHFTLEFVQNGTGGFTVTGWPANVFWSNGVQPVFGDAANARRIVALYYNGTTEDDYYGEFRLRTYT